MKEKFGALQEEYQRAMKNSIEKKKASEDADIYRDAIGVSMIATANKFADFLKANGTHSFFSIPFASHGKRGIKIIIVRALF